MRHRWITVLVLATIPVACITGILCGWTRGKLEGAWLGGYARGAWLAARPMLAAPAARVPCFAIEGGAIHRVRPGVGKRPSKLVFFPGHGERAGRRTELLKHSLAKYDPEEWTCVVLSYERPTAPAWDAFWPCETLHAPGARWTHLMRLVTPGFLSLEGYTHVSVHINDVQYGEHTDMGVFMSEMSRLGLQVASPNVVGSIYSTMAPLGMERLWPGRNTTEALEGFRPWKGGALVHFIEVQATVFTARAWSCFWALLEPSINPHGWGHDLGFYRLCGRPRMGVLNHLAVHWGSGWDGMGGLKSTTHEGRFIKGLKNQVSRYGLWVNKTFSHVDLGGEYAFGIDPFTQRLV